jgi:hypothetical protein
MLKGFSWGMLMSIGTDENFIRSIAFILHLDTSFGIVWHHNYAQIHILDGYVYGESDLDCECSRYPCAVVSKEIRAGRTPGTMF